jgi:hypothetical protein
MTSARIHMPGYFAADKRKYRSGQRVPHRSEKGRALRDLEHQGMYVLSCTNSIELGIEYPPAIPHQRELMSDSQSTIDLLMVSDEWSDIGGQICIGHTT